MKQMCLLILVGIACMGSPAAETVTLSAAKDNFGRSNRRNRNNGASEILYLAHAPSVRTIVAFDLSSVTNKILEATLRFQPADSNGRPLSLTVAPMVQTENNSSWIEGAGQWGASGRNSQPGESCYSWRSFPDGQWEDASENMLVDLADARLWSDPLVAGKALPWESGSWIELELPSVACLEEVRGQASPMLTFGLWGTAGSGLYGINSRESGSAPELILVTEEPKKKSGPMDRALRSLSF
jgi:hypothetical protein